MNDQTVNILTYVLGFMIFILIILSVIFIFLKIKRKEG